MSFVSILQVSVLQIMDSHYQLSERTRSDGIFPALKASYCALSKSGPAREKLSGKLFCLCPDFFQFRAFAFMGYRFSPFPKVSCQLRARIRRPGQKGKCKMGVMLENLLNFNAKPTGGSRTEKRGRLKR